MIEARSRIDFERYAADILALAKPRVTFLVLATTLAGLVVAPGKLSFSLAALAMLGVALVVAGANALNMYYERDTDALMARTRNRPLPAGRLHPDEALFFGWAAAICGVALLLTTVNVLTAVLSALSFIIYVWGYTPLKRRSTAALLVGAVPGAMPPLLGWTAATGSLGAPGQTLFLILFVWQLPHFLAISLFRRDEYERAGIKIVPSEYGLEGTKVRILLYSVLLIAVSLQPVRTHMGSLAYLVVALLLGGAQMGLAFSGFRAHPHPKWDRALFVFSLLYLPALFAALLVHAG